MSQARQHLGEGSELAAAPYLLDADAAEAYGQSVKEPPRRRAKNIHSDPDAAAKAGFSKPIAAGEQTIALMMQLLADRFGEDFYRGGRFEVALVKPVLYGDTLNARARVERIANGFAELSIRVDNQRGEAVLTGTARAPVAPLAAAR
ncbi:MAG TPA: MaoC family dehydratase [Candidatus Binataceae bacterium]|nr:MaoC family dehydratase [Candidatus Binataceae bacterium]